MCVFFLKADRNNECCFTPLSIILRLRAASHAVGRRFAPRPSHTKDHYKNGTNCLPAWHTGFRVGISQCSQSVLKAW